MRAACALLVVAVGCNHAPVTPARVAGGAAAKPDRAQPDPVKAAAEISDETRALLRTEGELLWQRWTTGAGAMPASALAEHPRLLERDSLDLVTVAAARKPDSRALQLLRLQLATLQIARAAGAEIDALERARSQLAFTAPGDSTPRAERDLDRLLTGEPSAQKRAQIAQAEARAALALAPLVIARDAAVERAVAGLNLGGVAALEERRQGMTLANLAALAEQTLAATEDVAKKAVAAAAVRNLGVTADRLRRSDLARMVRTALADPQFPAGHAWPAAKDALTRIGVELPLSLRVDAEPSPSKAARPLALLVNPPADVRLSLRPAGGFEEQRATFHEAARAAGGVLTQVTPWELSQLGDGSAVDGTAQLFENLAGDPAWLRDATQLRGEPLDDLVHTQATRRLLAARRSAAMVLFEVKRREGPRTPEAQAALYRGLVQRATFAVLSDDDAARWALEADSFVNASPLLGALLAAQLELQKAAASAPNADAGQVPAGTEPLPWWKSPESGAALKKLWAQGRSLTAMEAARALGQTALDPSALAQVAAARLAYAAPEAPPPTPRPDYKYMQGDKKKRRHRKQ